MHSFVSPSFLLGPFNTLLRQSPMGAMMLKRSSISRSRIKPVSEGTSAPWKSIMMAPLKSRPDHPFLAFTTSEHLGAPVFANYSSLYQLLILFSIFFCGIIQDDTDGLVSQGRLLENAPYPAKNVIHKKQFIITGTCAWPRPCPERSRLNWGAGSSRHGLFPKNVFPEIPPLLLEGLGDHRQIAQGKGQGGHLVPHIWP